MLKRQNAIGVTYRNIYSKHILRRSRGPLLGREMIGPSSESGFH